MKATVSTAVVIIVTVLVSDWIELAVSRAAPEPPSSYFPSSGGGGGVGGGGGGGGGVSDSGRGGGSGGSVGGGAGNGYPAAVSGSSGSPVFPDRYGPPQQQPVIHKHVYVHVPPPEAPEYKPPKVITPPAQPQKHYKIVFIKAPTPPTPTAPVLPALPPQDEEKTLIYVLVKKPEEAPEVVLPTQAPTQPSKPEVYFIRYKTQKDTQQSTVGRGGGEYGPPLLSQQSGPIDSYGSPQGGNRGY